MGRDQTDLAAALTKRLQEALLRAQEAIRESQLVTAASRLARDQASMTKRCAWCGRLDVGFGWHAVDHAPPSLVATLERRATHTICPDCVRRLEESGQSRRTDDVSAHGKSAHGEQARDPGPEHGDGEP